MAAVATAGSAVATLVAAAFTARMANETRKMAERTEAEAEATMQSAAAAAAVAEQGLLAYQPVLSIGNLTPRVAGEPAPGTLSATLEFENAGMGPAIGATFAWQSEGRWCRVRTDLKPGAMRKLTAGNETGGVPFHWFVPEAGKPPVPGVLFCRDVMGRRYRFLIDSRQLVWQPTIVREADCPPSSADLWLSDPLLWPARFVDPPGQALR